jgi:biotin carboxylase
VKKVLVLGVASVQMDAIEILKELGHETFACAMSEDGPGALVADHFDIINILDISKLKRHIIKNDINLVYSVGSDLAMPIACKLSEDLNLPHFVSYSTAKACNNKDMMREILGSDCKGNISYKVIDNKKEIPEFQMPYIMKPADSQGQRGIVLVKSIEDFYQNYNLVKNYSRSGKVIVEKYVEGPELSVNAYMVDGNLNFMIASDRETWPQHTGLIHKHVVPTTAINKNQLLILKEVVEDSCNRIGIKNGPVYFQIKVENKRPYIIEITPRLDGCHMWKLLKYHTGINLLKLTFEHLINGDISELSKKKEINENYELEFFCKEPNTIMNQDEFIIPKESLEHFFYYNSGEQIRPVNGKYEMVGYFIRSKGEK